MEFEQIIKLIETVSSSGLTRYDYETDGVKLHMGQKKVQTIYENLTVSGTRASESIESTIKETVASDAVPVKNGTDVVSPIVGVFYAASSPDAAPFVKVGDHVQKGQVIGIVEAMKLMNEIPSDVTGIITEIYVQNGDGVEYGQPIICVKESE